MQSLAIARVTDNVVTTHDQLLWASLVLQLVTPELAFPGSRVGNELRLLYHKPDITLGFLKGIAQTAIWPGTCPFLNSDGNSRFRAFCRMAKPYRQPKTDKKAHS